ncbi:hypothetical protein FA95DRAFT_545022 [Auriscalpium vulgare]|uniref:Uncharacterized protein n=1 Tax=Auriscalpium vulgare TaxID=40419 RepID=A0ACB8RGI1_9AGAM|nr:hypothetical protein FA95DRAFT_545022 [Auriscalpium vulgare]
MRARRRSAHMTPGVAAPLRTHCSCVLRGNYTYTQYDKDMLPPDTVAPFPTCQTTISLGSGPRNPLPASLLRPVMFFTCTIAPFGPHDHKTASCPLGAHARRPSMPGLPRRARPPASGPGPKAYHSAHRKRARYGTPAALRIRAGAASRLQRCILRRLALGRPWEPPSAVGHGIQQHIPYTCRGHWRRRFGTASSGASARRPQPALLPTLTHDMPSSRLSSANSSSPIHILAHRPPYRSPSHRPARSRRRHRRPARVGGAFPRAAGLERLSPRAHSGSPAQEAGAARLGAGNQVCGR